MAMGFNNRPRGLFDRPPGWTPGIVPDQNTVQEAALPAAPRSKGGGIFAGNSPLWKVLGALGDSFSSGPPVYGMAQQQQRQTLLEQQMREQERAQSRMDARDDWQWREQWERDHPKPVNNDTAADYAFWQQRLTPEEFEQWKKNKINPPVWRQGPDGQFYPVQTQAAPPPDTLPADFDFGGGPASQAPGGFPR